jgi:hypothetical protein
MARPKKGEESRDSIHITADQKGGEYQDVVEFAHERAAIYGSAANAVAQAVRSSPVFGDWTAKKGKKKPAGKS